MPSEMLLFYLGVLLLGAKIFGEIVERLGVTSLVGEVLAGVILGPLLGLVQFTEFRTELLLLGIIFILFLAGMEVIFDEIKDSIYSASIVAFAGGILSFAGGLLVGVVLFNSIAIGIAIGIIMISTSNSAVFDMLLKAGSFGSYVGKFIIASTIVDDVIGIVALSFFTLFITSNRIMLSELGQLLLVSIGFYLIILTAGTQVFNKVLKIGSMFRDSTILLSIPLVLAFMGAVFTEKLGLGFAAGAFLIGMAIAKNKFTKSIIIPKTQVIANSFFVPIFYAIVGTMLVLQSLNWILVTILLAVAILGKIIGSGILSNILGFRGKDAQIIGLSMIPRGDSNIAIAQIAFLIGILTVEIYSSVIMVIILTLILSPILFKIFSR